MQQKLFQFFFTTRSWSENNIEKERHAQVTLTPKSRPKLKNIYITYSHSFLQKYINFVEQRLKFSHFKRNIIP